MDLLMNNSTYSALPSYASDLGHDMGLFSGHFPSNPSHSSSLPIFGPSVGGPTLSSHLHPMPSLQSPPLCETPSLTNVANTFSDRSGGQIPLEAGPSANVDGTQSLPIQCPPETTPSLSLVSGFGDLFGDQISSTVGPATANPETPPPTQFASKTIASKPPLSLSSGFGDLFGVHIPSTVGPATTISEAPLSAPVDHRASSASLPPCVPPMGHISPPIVTNSHLPLSVPCGSLSPTLPGTTMTSQFDSIQQRPPGASHADSTSLTASALPNISPTMQPPPSQGVTESVALPTDKSRSGRPLVPSKHLEAMHKIGFNVPKGLPPTEQPPEQPPEKENCDPKAPPEWMALAREHLLTRNLGSEWKGCVDSWLELEARLGYGTMTGTKVCRDLKLFFV